MTLLETMCTKSTCQTSIYNSKGLVKVIFQLIISVDFVTVQVT